MTRTFCFFFDRFVVAVQDRIIREPEIKEFEKMLKKHQMAVTSTGRTVLQNALVEHNMLAASKIYNNVRSFFFLPRLVL